MRNTLKTEITTALQVSATSGQGTTKGQPGRAAMPISGTAFRANLWNSMERMMEHLYLACVKVQHLQKVSLFSILSSVKAVCSSVHVIQ